MPDYMTRDEVAALFRVHPKTVTRWAREGQLKAARLNHKVQRYERTEVQKLVDRMRK